MKPKIFTFLLALLLPFCMLHSQTEYVYPLQSSFHALQPGAPDLIVIPNNSGDTGNFVVRPIPASTCGTTGQAPGYFFSDDSGLQFNVPEGFIDKAYSLSMNFQVDEFISPPSWVRLLSFTHTDDVGIYIKLTDPPNHGTLEFWPYGSVGTTDFFSPADFYQMILVRDTSSLIKVYINGQEFAQYNDATTQAYVPQDPTNYIIFFRDDPSVLANEASPGFVSSIKITNEVWAEPKIQLLWSQFCSNLMDVQESPTEITRLFPNPVSGMLTLERPTGETVAFMITDLSGKQIKSGLTTGKRTVLDVSSMKSGMYWIKINEEAGPQFLKFIRK